jgi:hypothetical protein
MWFDYASPPLTFILIAKLALNYARFSGTQRLIKCDSTVFFGVRERQADPCGRAVSGLGLRPLACWEYGFEYCWGHGCLSLVSAVYCQVELSASDRSLVQRSPTECGVSECDREASVMRMPWPTRGCWALGRERVGLFIISNAHYLHMSIVAWPLRMHITELMQSDSQSCVCR